MSHLSGFHRRFDNSVRWRLTPVGVEIEGVGIPRTVGPPSTATRVWGRFAGEINAAAKRFDVPAVHILATMLVESRGDPNALRLEPGFVSDEETPDQVSPGLMQTLISTARSALDDPTIDRQRLFDPSTSINAGTAYMHRQRGRTELDPPVVAAAYNAGGVYEQKGADNRWKMRQYPIGTGAHCDRFVEWFNDGVFVLDRDTVKAEVVDDARQQHGWRWCNKCKGLFFGGHGPWVCPAGGPHDPEGSGVYTLVHDCPAAAGQRNWRWCNRCGVLSYGAHGPSLCAAGGAHNQTGSWDYTLNHSPGAPGQSQWRWCNSCGALVFGPHTQSACPRGGAHLTPASWDYTLARVGRG